MKKLDIHKIIFVFALLLLACTVGWWIQWQRKHNAATLERKLMDSISIHMQQAETHADIARKYLEETEKYAKVYNDTLIDSARRAKLGAEIWANAVRKADSLRKRAP